MIKSEKVNVHRDWKIVRKLEIENELEREIEKILGQQLFGKKEKKQDGYQTKRRSIFQKNKKNRKIKNH